MAHEITATDGLVLTAKRAWHGLGVVVEQAPTPLEALKIAQLDWSVEQWPLTAHQPPQTKEVDTHVLNVRTDTCTPLGVVGRDYQPVQNRELAQFVQALSEAGEIKIESAGSIRGGRRVWFLVQGDSIWVDREDEVRPYLLVANGHDGSLAMTCQPTTIRVVCRNTLDSSLRAGAASAVRFRHEGDMTQKLAEARRALGLFAKAREEVATTLAVLDAKEMAREDLQRFWLDVYAATVEPIPAHPTTNSEKARVKHAQETLATWASNFDRDRSRVHADANAWIALNAVTEWFDHQRRVRGSDQSSREENRTFSKLWGTAAVAKRKAMEMALSR